MRAVQKTYCTKPFLDEAIQRRKDSAAHKVALRIIENLSDVYVDMPSEDLRALIVSNPYYNKLSKRESKNFRSSLNWKDTVAFDDVADSVFLIHQDYIPEYKNIMEHCGCLIVASDDKEIRLLERMNDKRGYICIVPPQDRNAWLDSAYQESWEEALQTCNVRPINSAIISDNYIFTKIDSSKEKGLFALLRALVPSELTVPFHLAIFSHIGNGTFSRSQAESLIEEIKSLFPNQEMKVTIVVHSKKSTTHDREIITNYHRLTSGAGFSVITDADGTKEVAQGHIEPVFHTIVSTPDTAMGTKHFHFQLIEWLKPLFYGKQGVASTTFIVGDREHRMFENTILG